MGKMTKGTCSVCGEEIVVRERQNFIKKMGEHFRKEHPEAFSRRISRGIKESENIPDLQAFTHSLNGDPNTALSIYAQWTEKNYQDVKRFMIAFDPYLSPEMKAGWAFIEVMHDTFVVRPRR